MANFGKFWWKKGKKRPKWPYFEQLWRPNRLAEKKSTDTIGCVGTSRFSTNFDQQKLAIYGGENAQKPKKSQKWPFFSSFLVFADLHHEGGLGGTFCIKDELKFRTQRSIWAMFEKNLWTGFWMIFWQRKGVFFIFLRKYAKRTKIRENYEYMDEASCQASQ